MITLSRHKFGTDMHIFLSCCSPCRNLYLTGDTPLIHAARLGYTDTAKLLLEYGANPSIASDLGATALHHSAGLGVVL